MLALAVAALTPTAAAPASPPATSVPSVQIEKTRIDRALAQMIASDRAVGASALIWKDGREVYFGTAGFADREARKPMRRDTLAQIWSMTKPVTGVAVMQLWEQASSGSTTRCPITFRNMRRPGSSPD